MCRLKGQSRVVWEQGTVRTQREQDVGRKCVCQIYGEYLTPWTGMDTRETQSMPRVKGYIYTYMCVPLCMYVCTYVCMYVCMYVGR